MLLSKYIPGEDNSWNIPSSIPCRVSNNAGKEISTTNQSCVSLDSKICRFHLRHKFNVNGYLRVRHQCKPS